MGEGKNIVGVTDFTITVCSNAENKIAYKHPSVLWAEWLLSEKFVLTFISTDDEGATPVKRRRVSSDEEPTVDSCISDLKTETREALTPTSTSDNETRDSSIIDPGTEQDLPSPENSSVKEYRMEVPSSFSEDIRSQHAEQSNNGRFEDCKEFKDLPCSKDPNLAEEESEFPSTSISAVLSDLADLRSCDGPALPSQDPEAALSLSCGHSRGLFSHMQQHDILDTLCRTIESTIHVVTRISGKGNQAASWH